MTLKISTKPPATLKPDFGTLLYQAAQTSPVHLQILSTSIDPIYQVYKDRPLVEVTVVMTSYCFSAVGDTALPLFSEPACVTITGFKKRHAAEAAYRRLCRDGAEIVAVPTAQFTTPHGEVVLPIATTWGKPSKDSRKGFAA